MCATHMKMIIINDMAARASLVSADLDELVDEFGTGSILLTVPVLDDAIQVGIGGDYPTTTIAVSTTATELHVRHLDGRPMQVHIVRDWRDAGTPGIRTTLFGDPVDHLLLRRHGQSWITGTALPSCREADLETFVNTVARFALAKRRRSAQGVAA